jgi:hypothetical protein
MTARRTLAIAAAALLSGVGDVLLVLGSGHGTPEVSSRLGRGTRLRRHLPCK